MPSDDIPDLLQDAVAALLRRVPDRWAEYDADALTATESQALCLLVAAGMVERRIRLRARLHNHPVAVEATITATGEYGFVEAIEPVLASMWGEWKDAYRAWRTGETRGAPLSVTEHLKPDEWRLTEQGALARADLDGGQAERALDFVLRRGFFDGTPCLILEPGRERISQRESVRGYGRLVTMRKVQADTLAPPTVNIGNWKEGADIVTAAVEAVAKAVFEAKAKGTAKTTSDAATPTKAKRSTERGEGRVKLIAALTKHHKYADGGCLNLEPIGNNELARLARVSDSTASAFFQKQFKGHANYRRICGDAQNLVAALKLLNQEYAPHDLYGSNPPDEGERADEDEE